MLIPNARLPKMGDVHRLPGRGKGGRPLLVTLKSNDSKSEVMGFVKNLKGKSASVGDQLPKQMQERRSAQLQHLKKEKEKNPGSKCRLVRDKLFVDQHYIDPKFERNPVVANAGSNFGEVLTKVKSSNVHLEKNSKFQSHAADISSVADAQSVLAAVLSRHPLAEHRVYAYRFLNEKGEVVSGHSDDKEWGASQLLMQELEEAGTSKMVVVTRYYGGLNLGQRRFDIYSQAARAAAT